MSFHKLLGFLVLGVLLPRGSRYLIIQEPSPKGHNRHGMPWFWSPSLIMRYLDPVGFLGIYSRAPDFPKLRGCEFRRGSGWKATYGLQGDKVMCQPSKTYVSGPRPRVQSTPVWGMYEFYTGAKAQTSPKPLCKMAWSSEPWGRHRNYGLRKHAVSVQADVRGSDHFPGRS